MQRSLHPDPYPASPSLPSADGSLPTLSVILSACNAQDHLHTAVQAVLEGAPQELEIIVAADGSAGETPAIADTLERAENKVSVLHLPPGLSAAARNAGLAAASGDYVGFLNANDRVASGWARVLLAAAVRHPAIIKGEGRIVCEGHELPLPRSCAVMARHTPLHWFGYMSSAIYRRDFVQGHGLHFAAECGGDDVDFQVRAVVAALVSGEKIALRPRAICRQLRSRDADSLIERRQVACSLRTYAGLHELFLRYYRRLPAAGVGVQYGIWLHRLFAIARRAAHPADAAAANALAQRLILECPLPEEYERERTARVYAVSDSGYNLP